MIKILKQNFKFRSNLFLALNLLMLIFFTLNSFIFVIRSVLSFKGERWER
jgi:hypothetical protein